MSSNILEMKGIDKSFTGVHALKDVDFVLREGEVHALLGENGAGKSTLIKILGGIHKPDAGSITISGEKVMINDPLDAKKLGIAIIHQELILAENMSVAENIFIGSEKLKNGFFSKAETYKEAEKAINVIGINIDLSTMVMNLSTAYKQMVEIVKAISARARIIVMDEPTSALSDDEVKKLFEIIRMLKNNNTSIIYISHRLYEIYEIADRITVLRDGQSVGTRDIKDVNEEILIKLMVGREITQYFPHKKREIDQVIFEAKNISSNKLKNVSLYLKKGEILGLAGLMGAGRTEFAKAVFGIDKIESGEILIDGKPVKINMPKDAMDLGISLVPESRKEDGLILVNSVGFNMTLCVLHNFINYFVYDRKKENEIINHFTKRLNIKAYSKDQVINTLSGGNQQKVVLSKWLSIIPKILILDEPTKGIDVGAKQEIYEIMEHLAMQDVSIIMISSELPEIVGMCDRVYVMNEGKITGCIASEDISQENIMRYSTKVV